MPPKRKRAEDSVVSSGGPSRTTRSSTRLSNTATVAGTSTSKKPSNEAAVEGRLGPLDADVIPDGRGPGAEKPPRSKKPRNAATSGKTSTEGKKGKGGSKAAVESALSTKIDAEQESSVTAMHRKHDEDAMPKRSVSIRNVTPPTPTKFPPATKALPKLPQASNPAQEPFSSTRSLALFKAYAEGEDTTIGPEGFEKLCNDAQIPLDGALPLILAWQLEAKDMGKFTRDEWMKGTTSLKISSLPQISMVVNDIQDLLILDKTPIKKSTNLKKDPYDRTAYHTYSDNQKAAFQKLYMFCFTLAKEEQSRNIDMETSIALWSVLLTRKYPLMQEVLNFITEKGTYKATNKDLWSMMLEFCETIKPSLEDYETDGAWPTLLDDFVTTKKSSMNGGNSHSDSTAIND